MRVSAGVGHLLGVYDGATGAAIEELAYLGERPVATVRSGTIYPIETDHLMAPLRVLDSTNAVLWSWEDREPFGASAPTTSGFTFNLRFPGQWLDSETGLVSNGFRDYDPVMGRYVEVDPLGLAAGMNPLGYVGVNPISGFDMYGLDTITVNLYGSLVGHIGISVNGSESVGYYPNKDESLWDDIKFLSGISENGHLKFDRAAQNWKDPSRSITVEISHDQADRANEAIKDMWEHPDSYNLYNNDCAHHAAVILRAAGMRGVPNSMFPDTVFEYVEKNYGGSRK